MKTYFEKLGDLGPPPPQLLSNNFGFMPSDAKQLSYHTRCISGFHSIENVNVTVQKMS